MELRIKLKDADKFIKDFLFDAIYDRFTEVYDAEKVKKMDSYLAKKDADLTTFDILDFAFSTLTYMHYADEYIITIDANRGFNGFNLLTLVKTIECGNLEVKGLRIVTKVFDWIADNIDDIYGEYIGDIA